MARGMAVEIVLTDSEGEVLRVLEKGLGCTVA